MINHRPNPLTLYSLSTRSSPFYVYSILFSMLAWYGSMPFLCFLKVGMVLTSNILFSLYLLTQNFLLVPQRFFRSTHPMRFVFLNEGTLRCVSDRGPFNILVSFTFSHRLPFGVHPSLVCERERTHGGLLRIVL